MITYKLVDGDGDFVENTLNFTVNEPLRANDDTVITNILEDTLTIDSGAYLVNDTGLANLNEGKAGDVGVFTGWKTGSESVEAQNAAIEAANQAAAIHNAQVAADFTGSGTFNAAGPRRLIRESFNGSGSGTYQANGESFSLNRNQFNSSGNLEISGRLDNSDSGSDSGPIRSASP